METRRLPHTSEQNLATTPIGSDGSTIGEDRTGDLVRVAELSGSTQKYLRGSSLLLGGRIISVALNFAVQILTVRYLSKSDYGAFAYALGVTSMGSSVVLLGLNKSVARFVPLYQEQKEQRKAFGAIALATATICLLGLALVLLLYGTRGMLLGSVVREPLALSLLLLLIFLSPLQAIDNLLQSLMAVFVGARAIFFRRHVLGPLLKLAAVLTVILAAGTVYHLAYGYLIGALIGVILYVSILVSTWRKQKLLRYLRRGRFEAPARELFGYSIPLLSSELMVVLTSSLAVIFLEYFQATTAVAEYRAVLPVARLNVTALQSFSLLFIPLASVMFARGDKKGIDNLYWQTAAWTSVLSFPVFAVTFALAEPLTLLMFGEEYRGAGSLLAVLALGYYFHAALGFNAQVLRVYGKVRYIVVIDVCSASIGLGLYLLLIPRYGAMGAAMATTATLIVYNLLNHLGLLVGNTGVQLLNVRYLKVYLLVAAVSIGLVTVQRWATPPVWVNILLAIGASMAMIRLTRHVIKAHEAFPKFLRIPGLRWLLT